MKTAAILLSLGFSATALAGSPTTDAEFLQKAAQGGLTEVEAGQLAESKGTSDAVRKFGAMMVEQHGATNEKLAKLAKSKNITLPTAPSEKQTETLKGLQAKEGARFDQEYLAEMVKAHEATVQLLQAEISSGVDADTKAFARETLPTVKTHLREAYRLTGQDALAASMPE